ncbi:hypothetical protein BJ912DRAFT_957233 [Pholiota molesta]|nr:hypothetical protein BJ912DRAFT_957233 [Pholiota molesta]
MPSQHLKGKSSKSKPHRQSQSSSYSFVTKIIVSSLAIAVLSALYYYQYGSSTNFINAQNGHTEVAIEDSVIFTVVDLPGKGKGAIAARDIKQGEVILREKPLFVVPLRINTSPAALIAAQLAALSPAERATFHNLSYVNFPEHLDPHDSPDEVALAIFQTNAVSAGQNVGIFPRMARLNHGCSSAFNVVYTWREEGGGYLIVHALKSIPKGRELLTTYTDSKRPRHERRAYLSQQYGFHCTCDVCSLPDALSKASDERLSAISTLYEVFATWGSNTIEGPEAIDHIRKIWQLEDQEGYWSERGQLAADAAWIAAAHSESVNSFHERFMRRNGRLYLHRPYQCDSHASVGKTCC